MNKYFYYVISQILEGANEVSDFSTNMFLSNFNLYKRRFVLSILPLIIIIQSVSKWSKEEAIKRLNVPSDVPQNSDEKDYWTKLLVR